MSRTPEVIISAHRKFLRNVLGVTGLILFVPGAIMVMATGTGFLWAILGGALLFAADRTKYKLVKKVEVGGYELT